MLLWSLLFIIFVDLHYQLLLLQFHNFSSIRVFPHRLIELSSLIVHRHIAKDVYHFSHDHTFLLELFAFLKINVDGIGERYGFGFELGVEMGHQEVEKDILTEIVYNFPHFHNLLNATVSQFQIMSGYQPDILNQRIVITFPFIKIKYLVLTTFQISLNSCCAFPLPHQPKNTTHRFDVGQVDIVF